MVSSDVLRMVLTAIIMMIAAPTQAISHEDPQSYTRDYVATRYDWHSDPPGRLVRLELADRWPQGSLTSLKRLARNLYETRPDLPEITVMLPTVSQLALEGMRLRIGRDQMSPAFHPKTPSSNLLEWIDEAGNLAAAYLQSIEGELNVPAIPSRRARRKIENLRVHYGIPQIKLELEEVVRRRREFYAKLAMNEPIDPNAIRRLGPSQERLEAKLNVLERRIMSEVYGTSFRDPNKVLDETRESARAIVKLADKYTIAISEANLALAARDMDAALEWKQKALKTFQSMRIEIERAHFRALGAAYTEAHPSTRARKWVRNFTEFRLGWTLLGGLSSIAVLPASYLLTGDFSTATNWTTTALYIWLSGAMANNFADIALNQIQIPRLNRQATSELPQVNAQMLRNEAASQGLQLSSSKAADGGMAQLSEEAIQFLETNLGCSGGFLFNPQAEWMRKLISGEK